MDVWLQRDSVQLRRDSNKLAQTACHASQQNMQDALYLISPLVSKPAYETCLPILTILEGAI